VNAPNKTAENKKEVDVPLIQHYRKPEAGRTEGFVDTCSRPALGLTEKPVPSPVDLVCFSLRKLVLNNELSTCLKRPATTVTFVETRKEPRAITDNTKNVLQIS
jgi:hypothetical protein